MELEASAKLLTELATFAASFEAVAIWLAEGFADTDLTELASASTEDLMALVWLGKSPLASLTTVLASVWIFLTCDCRPLIPLLEFKLVSPLTEFSRLVRAEQ